IVTTFRYTRKKTLRSNQRIDELYIDLAAANRLSKDPLEGLPSDWRDVFCRIDQFLKRYEECPIVPLREKALKEAEKWLLVHLEGTERLGVIFAPMGYMLLVFRCLGYPEEHELVTNAHKQLEDFFIQDGDKI